MKARFLKRIKEETSDLMNLTIEEQLKIHDNNNNVFMSTMAFEAQIWEVV